jgi:hypothetical protein
MSKKRNNIFGNTERILCEDLTEKFIETVHILEQTNNTRCIECYIVRDNSSS